MLRREDGPTAGRGGGPPPELLLPERLRREANVAAESGRSGGVPPADPAEQAEKEPDDSRPLFVTLLPSPSYDPRLPMLLPLLLRPARPPPGPSRRTPGSPKLPLLLLPPLPPPPALPTELHLGRRTALLRRLSAMSFSFRALYSASLSSIVRLPSSTSIGEFWLFSLLLGVGDADGAGDDRARDDDGDDDDNDAAVVGRKSASDSAIVNLTPLASGVGINGSPLDFSVLVDRSKSKMSDARNRKQRLCRLQQAGRLVSTLTTGQVKRWAN